jgi:hypothetical protein
MIHEGERITIEMDEERMLEIDVEITYLGCPPSFSDWDGGHPGDPLEYEIKDIRVHPDELVDLPEDPGSMTKEEAAAFLDYTVEEFDKRLDREVNETFVNSSMPEHDYVRTWGGYLI